MSPIRNKQKGTTLIEITVYFAIVSFVLLAAMNLAIETSNISKKSENFHEIQANIDIISQKIVSTAKEADSINTLNSIFDNDIGKLSLNVSDAQKTPTEFYLSDGDVYIKEGASAAIKINSEAVECTKLRFQKVSFDKAPDNIVINAEFNSKFTNIASLNQQLSFHTSVSLRK